NTIGTAGLAPAASIVVCRFMDATGSGFTTDALACIDYCLEQGVHVLQNSWGDYQFSAAFTVVAKAVESHGAVMVASAGNDRQNTDTIDHVPSTLSKGSPIVLGIAAMTADFTVWSGSNYGNSSVQLAAPGAQVPGLGL